MRKIVIKNLFNLAAVQKNLAEKPIEKDSVELENLHIADLKPARMQFRWNLWAFIGEVIVSSLFTLPLEKELQG